MPQEQASAETVVIAPDSGSPAPEKEVVVPDVKAEDEAQRKQLSDTLAQRGRELKQARDDAAQAKAQLAEERAKREQMWYEHEATQEEKDDFRKRRESEAKDSSKVAQLTNKASLLEAIAEEDNPTALKALRALKAKSDKSGKYPDADSISALRESFVSDDEETEEPTPSAEKTPVAVKATPGTRQVMPSIDEQISTAEKSVRLKDGKFTYGDLLALRGQKTALDKARSQG
jgi:hypothetical protein